MDLNPGPLASQSSSLPLGYGGTATEQPLNGRFDLLFYVYTPPQIFKHHFSK